MYSEYTKKTIESLQNEYFNEKHIDQLRGVTLTHTDKQQNQANTARIIFVHNVNANIFKWMHEILYSDANTSAVPFDVEHALNNYFTTCKIDKHGEPVKTNIYKYLKYYHTSNSKNVAQAQRKITQTFAKFSTYYSANEITDSENVTSYCMHAFLVSHSWIRHRIYACLATNNLISEK